MSIQTAFKSLILCLILGPNITNGQVNPEGKAAFCQSVRDLGQGVIEDDFYDFVMHSETPHYYPIVMNGREIEYINLDAQPSTEHI